MGAKQTFYNTRHLTWCPGTTKKFENDIGAFPLMGQAFKEGNIIFQNNEMLVRTVGLRQ